MTNNWITTDLAQCQTGLTLDASLRREPLQLSIKRASFDAKNRGGATLVSLGMTKHSFDVSAFQRRQRHLRGTSIRSRICVSFQRGRQGEIGIINVRLGIKNHGAFDHIL